MEAQREILQEGVLCKQSVSTVLGKHNWKTRYFVLDDRRSLCYYDLSTGILKCQIALTGDTTVKNTSNIENGLEIITPYVKLTVKASTAILRDAWRHGLHCVIKDAHMNKNKLTAVRKRAKEMRMPQQMGETGRGTHMFKAGGSTFEVDTRYTLEKVIGQGSYGVVVAANDSVTGSQVAIKKISGVFRNVIDGKRILREVKLLRFLRHKNISHIIDLMRPAPIPGQSKLKFDDVYIVLDRMDTDLNRVIYSDQQLSDQHIQFLMFQLLSAVHYCETANVVHRDLKPSNILVNAKCELRVCDFGLARGMQASGDELTTYVVTRWYRAPELILACYHYSSAIDMWSVGCIFAELITRKALFAGEDFLHQLRLICQVLGSPSNEDLEFMSEGSANRYLRDMEFMPRKDWREVPGLENASDKALDLINRMLAFSPTKRISALEALKHPYLETYHKQPIRSAPVQFDIESIETMNLTRKQLREAMMEEIKYFRGDCYDDTRQQSSASASSTPSRKGDMDNSRFVRKKEESTSSVTSATFSRNREESASSISSAPTTRTLLEESLRKN